MVFAPIERTDKTGQTFIIRSPEKKDAETLIEYLKVVNAETPFLIREPDEVTLTIEDEIRFIESTNSPERDLMLIAVMDGKHIGNCSLAAIGPYKRNAHRCNIAIALYQEYCGRGVGRIMMEMILDEARKAGYEQAELEVICGNDRAKSLYESLGFETHGRFPNNMKYADGSYADAEWMIKRL